VRITWPKGGNIGQKRVVQIESDVTTWCPRCEDPIFSGGHWGLISLCANCSSSSPPEPEEAARLKSLPSSPTGAPNSMTRTMSFATQCVVNEVVDAVSVTQQRPELTQEGTGGVYLIRRQSKDSTAQQQRQEQPIVGVFKPTDEEAGAQNNPRGLRGDEYVMREGFCSGDSAAREMVAYRLDHGFAGVPRTAVDKLMLRTHTGSRLCEQSGSIQQFVPSEGDASGYRFDGSEFEPAQCQRIALLDCRLFNCDRHEGNILVQSGSGSDRSTVNGATNTRATPPLDEIAEATPLTAEIIEGATTTAAQVVAADADAGHISVAAACHQSLTGGVEGARALATAGTELPEPKRGIDPINHAFMRALATAGTELPDPKRRIVPIDHAFILPRFGYYREAEFVWRYWVAAQEPFGPEAARYVASLDVEADVNHARSLGLEESSCATLRVCTMLIKAAFRSVADSNGGLTPYALGRMLMREEYGVPSPLERMCARALGVEKEAAEHGTALIDHVRCMASQREPQDSSAAPQPNTPADVVPPAEFYERFAALLADEFPPSSQAEVA